MPEGSNIASETGVAYPQLSMETVLKEDPEIIVFPIGKGRRNSRQRAAAMVAMDSLSAVKQGRLHQIPADVLNRPGPRIVEGLEGLARIIHPEAFPVSIAP